MTASVNSILRMSCDSSTRGPQRLPAHAPELALVAGGRAARRLLELLLALLEAHPRLPDRLDLAQDLPFAIVDLVVGQLFVDKRHELADAPLLVLELIAHRHDRAGDRWRAGDRLDDRQLAALDALGDLDFAFSREEGDRAHLAQVHANGVVGLVERAWGQVELELLGPLAGAIEQLVFAVLLFGIDDFDSGAPERAEQIIELVRRRDVGGQQFVDLVVEQVALFLADGYELLYFVVFFFDRQRRVLLSVLVPRVSKYAAYDSAINCNNVFFRSHSATISDSCVAAPASCRRSISR